MKRISKIAALLTAALCAVPLTAQTTETGGQTLAAPALWRPFAVGLGVEVNNNNPSGAAAGFWAAGDARFFAKLPRLSFAARVEFSSNFGVSNTLEGALLAR